MEIKFDAEAAEQLISQMSFYCLGIVKEARGLLDILKDSGEWDDLQKKAFENNMQALASDLNQALSLESEYMNTFSQRVKELRG